MNNLVDCKSNFECENKGFPFKVKLFWITIMSLWLFKIVNFCYFSFSVHQSIYQKLIQIQKYEKQKRYDSALEIHECLIAQYPKYLETHYFVVARCYLATSYTYKRFEKGMMCLLNKELTEPQLLELQDVMIYAEKEQFLSLFSAYEYKKSHKKIYVFENDEMEKKQ